jgi:superfamily II DNA or RNA helicase
MVISVNNNRTNIETNSNYDLAKKAYEEFKLKDPNAFFVRRYMQPGWDGYRRYITPNGSFKTGLLEKIYAYLSSQTKVKIVDNRPNPFQHNPNLQKLLKKISLRDYQYQAVESIVNNSVGNYYHPVGVIKAATNAGKTHIGVGLYYALGKRKTLFLLNSSDLHKQILKEIPEIGVKEVGFCQGKNRDLEKNLTVAMVQSLKSQLEDSRVIKFLASIEVLIVDEADLANNKTYKTVIQKCINAQARIGMSGSIYEGKLQKHKFAHEGLREIFGEVKYSITNKNLVDKGVSADVIIKIKPGNTQVKIKGSYDEEYLKGITKSKERNLRIYKDTKQSLNKGKFPILLVAKYHKHIDILHKLLRRKLGESLVIEKVSSATPTKERNRIIKDFREGHIKVLVSSLIVKRGMNFPLVETVINVGGGDDPKNPLQILGRAMRKKEGVSRKTYIDYMDEGHYLKRHSKHRLNYYKEQNLRLKTFF